MARFFQEKLCKSIDMDGDERLLLHHKVLKKKPLLQSTFKEFHHLFKALNHQFISGTGLEVELGAGVSLMRDTYPEVLATDVVPASHLDKVIDAEAMDFSDMSVRVFYAQNCFHHLSSPRKFFEELDRVLVVGGGAILIEPYFSPFSSFIHKRLFQEETFDKQAPFWETSYTGAMSNANQALSYVVFIRDVLQFEQSYPTLKIVHQSRISNYLKYLLSGGLNFRQLIPECLHFTLPTIQKILKPLDRWLALHHVIVLKKVDVSNAS